MAGRWPTPALDDLVDEILDRRGVTPIKLGSDFVSSGHRVISAKLIKSSRVDLGADEARFVDDATYRRWMRTPLLPDDVLLTSEAPLGEVAYIRSELDWCLGQRLFAIRTKKDRVYGRFLYYALQSKDVRDDLLSRATGTTAQGIRQSQLRLVRIPTPHPNEQRAIAHILGSLDDTIELNRRMNATLEEMARALFKSWFVHFDPVRAKMEGRDTGLPAEIGDLFPDGFEESELGEVPKGWRVQKLGDLCEITIGGDWGMDAQFDGGIEVICLRGVDLEHLRLRGHADAPRRWITKNSAARRCLDERDVLVAGSGAGPTGRPLWACPDIEHVFQSPVIYSNFCKRLHCQSPCHAVYIDRLLLQMRESNEIWEFVNGTSVPNLDANALLEGKSVVAPSVSVLKAYYEFARPIYQRLYQGESHTLAALRDTLLPKLISGEMRVEDAERFLTEATS